MSRIEIPAGDTPESLRLMVLQPDMGNAMAVLAAAIYEKSSLDKRVREAVRMRVAQINQCQLCLNFRFADLEAVGIDEAFYNAVSDWKNSELFDARERLAIEYAERFCNAHMDIDDGFFVGLNKAFSPTEVYELTTTIAGLLANGRILQVLQVEQSCAI
ncbi:MAG: carboxymuconolactone decarboxylase family protein [Pseudomonadales bacterium]|nr:carboxymuconolactone decarboxylase family protein [Pseudomonadales bacterium]